MRYKYILTVFLCSLPIIICARALQLIQLTDHTTGFMSKNKPAIVVTGFIAIIILLVSCCCATVRRAPLRTPKVRKPLGIGAFLMVISIAFDLAAVLSLGYLAVWQKLMLTLLAVCTMAFFMLYAWKAVKRYRLEKLLYAVPTIYFAARLVFTFISIATQALIAINAYMILAQCATLLFMFEFARIANGYGKDKSYKRILITGAFSVMFNAVFSVPEMFLLLTDVKAIEHQPPTMLISSMLTGVFVVIYLMAHFSNKNLKNHRYRHKKEDQEAKFLKIDSPICEFYYGD